MSVKSVVISIIIGIAIGSAGTFFVLDNFPILEYDKVSVNMETLMPFTEQQEQDDVLVTNNLKYTLVNVKKSDFGVNGETPLDGGIYVIVELQIENTGKEEVMIYGTNWFVMDSTERVYKPKTHNAEAQQDDKYFSISIPPGFQVIKKVGFEIPENFESSMALYVPNGPFESEYIFFGQIL